MEELGRVVVGTRVENPLPYFERVLKEVTAAFEDHCRKSGITYAELLDEARRNNEWAVTRYLELEQEIDCDVWGQWVNGSLTREALDEFYDTVDRWKSYPGVIIRASAKERGGQ